ncbi:peptidylprolyl isomerase [Vibrio palustris]|uniref:Peptidyl-prolyl cis-trans isomerase n=1 Tax=Vibrio palustris TaxID=1918946 RepID=A0A1R4AZW6_9VIBR|nr:peptidylprolyl isomerase [Vibrio palustris]SJL82204.1 Peptidyl-prolyl cis-trans isomerase A precursor [Vibrio palustris]
MAKPWLLLLALLSTPVLATPQVTFTTTLGKFTVELKPQQAPVTVKNFLRYVKDGSYVGSQFHRVIPGFMAQGGGFDSDLKRLKTYRPIKNEAGNGLTNDTATIAMARTQSPNSATRQFFINLADNNFLNYSRSSAGYAVFGKVVSGFDVVQSMTKQPTHNVGFMKNVPETPIVINKVTYTP